MLKFFKRHPPKEGEDRERLKKELFGFQKCADHGFPSKPSALAYDPKLCLLAIGTKSGAVRILGAPGVEVSAAHRNDVSVTSLFFLPEEGRLVSVCSDNSLHLWEVNTRNGTSVLDEKNSYTMESNKTKTISTCCLNNDGTQLLMGCEGGNIYILDTKTFQPLDQVIYQDIVMQNVPDDFKVSPGAVEAIAVHPTDPDKVLIGFNRGLIVLWNNKESNTEQTYNATQQLESLVWHRNGEEFMSAHTDGSYITWSAADSTDPKEPACTPYGPFPCKAINKLQWKTAKSDPFIIFSGGMPRASYGDRHTISVMQGDNHVVFDLTSRIVDYFTISRADESSDADRPEYDDPHALVILAEEELVVIDLDSPTWPAFRMPYLNSVHSSAITCSQHISNVPDQLWQKLSDAGDNQNKSFSKREWPINGGKNCAKDPVSKDLLLTGHEDGTVRFWDASASNLKLMYKLSTCPIFGIKDHTVDINAGEEEEWPPFRKVGTFDPYTDDPRLAIQKLALCPLSETLVIAGTAGQVVIFQMEREEREQDLKEVKVNIVSDRESFVWKGHEALGLEAEDLKYAAGFQPTCVMQLDPPAACTALALHSEWQLVGAGTAHGFALLDYAQKKEVASKCTLNPNDLTGTSESAMSRRKSLKKSLRESFRRLRRRRSEKRVKEEKPAEKKEEGSAAATATQHIEETVTAAATDAAAAAVAECKPVERLVEARSVDDSMASMVRALYFADTFIVNADSHTPSLWVGTNGGHVFVYHVSVPASDKRTSDLVSCLMAKEIRLKHAAPVLAMAVVDSKNTVLPDAFEVVNERAKAPDMEGQHSIIICSEEQFKTFSLPALKPRWKNKITAHGGGLVRKISFVNFRKPGDNYSEYDITCLTNGGDLRVHSVSTLRQQISESIIRKDDINGIASFVFTKQGQGFFLHSPSEFSRVSLSACSNASPVCVLELAEGMRPEPEPEAAAAPGPPSQPTVEVTPASEEQSQDAGGEADTTVVSEGGADDSRMTDSRVDTSADITIDSVRDVAAEAGETVVSSVRTITETTTTHVTETVASATQQLQQAVTVTNGYAEDKASDLGDVVRGKEHEVVTKTSEVSEVVSTKMEVVTKKGEDITEKLSELKMTTNAVIEDPSLIKQKVVETSPAVVNDIANSASSSTTVTDGSATTNGMQE